MAINWFPGHMHKARKEIKKVMPQMNLIIEVVDARLPFSSENPLVPALRGDTPVTIVTIPMNPTLTTELAPAPGW